MSGDNLSREIALRIGLAARQLENVDSALLLRVLAEVTGLPPTLAKLASLRPKQLKQAAGGELADRSPHSLKAACAILNGDRDEPIPPPVPEPLEAGEMPRSLRIACASNQGELIDGHFGSCRHFLIYQVSAEETRLIDVRPTNGPEGRVDKNAYRARLIADAQVLFVASIGGPAAAKVVRAGVHPIKQPQGGEARARIAELQAKISSSAAPWLAKAMGQEAETRVRSHASDADA